MNTRTTTRDEILAKLRHKPHTVGELVSGLSLTRNAILVPLLDLEMKGLVRRVVVERTGRVGKPAQRFEIVAEEIERISPAYQALAPHLLRALVDGASTSTKASMNHIGRSMAAEVAAASGTTGSVGLKGALAFLVSKGAEIETRTEGADLIVLSHSCPIGALVRVDPCICDAIAGFLQDSTGAKTTSDCSYDKKLTCRFRLRGVSAKIRAGSA